MTRRGRVKGKGKRKMWRLTQNEEEGYGRIDGMEEGRGKNSI